MLVRKYTKRGELLWLFDDPSRKLKEIVLPTVLPLDAKQVFDHLWQAYAFFFKSKRL